MKKMASILICIALAFAFAGCSWHMPEKVSVKTNADYNFSLGNFEKDFSENLNVSSMIGNLQLPNNGKVYDYWPNKKGDTQAFLMYMPLQEIPIDIGKYFDKGALSENIKNLSFEKEIEVPEVQFSLPVTLDLDDVNKEINKHFVLAGLVQNYNLGQFGEILQEIANSISYEKGVLVVEAHEITASQVSAVQAGTLSIQDIVNDANLATFYSGGNVSISSGNQVPLAGTFYDGVAELNIPSSGFEFIASNIDINFSITPSISNPTPLVFVAKFDTSRPYQIKKVSGLGQTITIPAVTVEKEINSLESLKSSGVDACEIGEGYIDIDFDIPTEWKDIAITYAITMSGGINLTSGDCTVTSGGNNNLKRVSLNNTSISAEKINVTAALAIAVAGATIDFTKPPAISFDSDIRRIKTVTVKLSDTNLRVADSQPLPDEVFNILKAITLNQCGIKGTYTNTLPGVDENGNKINEISLTVSSNFIGLESKTQTIEGGKTNQAFSIMTPVNDAGEPIQKTINLKKSPSGSDEFNAFDFDVLVGLPGGDPNKVTVSNVEPGETYKLAINVEPVIDWYSVTINTSSIPSQHDTIGTGFNPSTIFDSINGVLGEGFADNITIPDAKLYLYLTKPSTDKLGGFTGLSGSSISLYYGDADKNYLPNPDDTTQVKKNKISILESDDRLGFVQAPELETIKNEDESETVIQNIAAYETSLSSGPIHLSDLFNFTSNSDTEGAQLCVDYNIALADENGESNDIEIKSSDLGLDDDSSSEADSIGIYAIIELPLSFTVGANTDIDLKSLINKNDSEDPENSEEDNKDLFGRSEASGFDEIEKYLGVIESASIKYRLDSFPVKTSSDIELNLALGDNSGKKLTKKLAFATDSTEPITISKDEINQILDMYPLQLKTASISFPEATELSIPRTNKLDINMQISVSTDGSIELFGGKNN